MGRRSRRLAALLAAAVLALAVAPTLGALEALPDQLELSAGGETVIPVSAAVRAEASGGGAVAEMAEEADGLRLRAGQSGEGEVTFRLLGLVPLRTVKLSVREERVLVPGGQSVGVAMRTGGVVVVGSSDLGRVPSPARLAGLKSGDVIQRVDGQAVTSAAQLCEAVASGEAVRLSVLRGGEVTEREITPAMDARDGAYRLGAWVRDSTAGVGTLTFYDPENGLVGALGHAITDVDTGVLMPVGDGALYDNRVVGVTPSRPGEPGELSGDFMSREEALGSMTANTAFGIFGRASAAPEAGLYADGLPAASREQVRTGAAELLTTVSGGAVRAYACEIERLSEAASPGARAMVVRVTDPELLALTGGIVQGMSGSPLIQDGRIIGAVTHVMVNDPTMGYGILIETMLEAGKQAMGSRE